MRRVLAAAAVLALAAGCTSDDTARTAAPEDITIDVGQVAGPFDRRVLGTNVPAWVRPEKLADPTFQQLAIASGASVVRMPGGSWSSSYDWLACENADADGCYWTWAARPSDFVGFLAATGLEGMWTVSFNGTAQEAAALVAFFNGEVGDTRVIGTDRRGTDWGTVGQWASLRAEHGHPEPQPVQMWEVGNEVFGAQRDTAGGSCFEFGWEDVWTCDGEEYVHGDDEHDGFLAFRTAMQAVDPSIDVGAVGVSAPDSWGGFGTEVIDGTAGEMDFYVLHDYPFSSDADVESILERPQRSWPEVVDAVTPALAAAGATDVPVAVTEYGWIAMIDADTGAKLIRAVNALYIADVIGQMAASGVGIANQWNFANGAGSTGGDYGMVDLEDDSRYPQYYALAMWSRFGSDRLEVSSGFDAATTLSAYAAATPDGGITVLAVNKTGGAVEGHVRLAGATGPFRVTADVAAAAAVDATSMTFNGVAEPPIDLTEVAALPVAEVTDSFTYAFQPYSITVLQLTPAS
jgi:hypothetical protein